jgi:hypothetical protein
MSHSSAALCVLAGDPIEVGRDALALRTQLKRVRLETQKWSRICNSPRTRGPGLPVVSSGMLMWVLLGRAF